MVPPDSSNNAADRDAAKKLACRIVAAPSCSLPAIVSAVALATLCSGKCAAARRFFHRPAHDEGGRRLLADL